MQLTFDKISVDPIKLPGEKNLQVFVLRLDKIHPVVSGNKWFKLQYYFDEAKKQGKKKIITFGGAWSNHIIAVAAACKMYDLACAGIIRGERPALLSHTLQQAEEYGMELHFISRNDYSTKKVPVRLNHHEYYLIPEGGYGEKGARGAAHIMDHASIDFTHCCCAVGTGTMMAGLLQAATPGQKIIGISVMKNNEDLAGNIRALTNDKSSQWELIHDYHFGGYAKQTPALISFMNELYQQTGIPTDFVYTGKLFYAINDLALRNFFPQGSRLLLIHSGGLQGNSSLEKGTLIF